MAKNKKLIILRPNSMNTDARTAHKNAFENCLLQTIGDQISDYFDFIVCLYTNVDYKSLDFSPAYSACFNLNNEPEQFGDFLEFGTKGLILRFIEKKF